MIEKHLFAALFLVRNIGVQENPGILNDKTAIFDVYGTLSLYDVLEKEFVKKIETRTM